MTFVYVIKLGCLSISKFPGINFYLAVDFEDYSLQWEAGPNGKLAISLVIVTIIGREKSQEKQKQEPPALPESGLLAAALTPVNDRRMCFSGCNYDTFSLLFDFAISFRF